MPSARLHSLPRSPACRPETVLLLFVQHMLGAWPPPANGGGASDSAATSPMGRPGGVLRVSSGGALGRSAEAYLSALKACWEPCLGWYCAGRLTKVCVRVCGVW